MKVIIVLIDQLIYQNQQKSFSAIIIKFIHRKIEIILNYSYESRP